MCHAHTLFFFFNDTATTEIYTLSLHDALPISRAHHHRTARRAGAGQDRAGETATAPDRAAMSALQATGLAKSYKSRQVVRDLSLELDRGEVVGLLGPNGAGKTTAFYMIVGLVPCDAGRIRLEDTDVTLLPMHRRAAPGPRALAPEASVVREATVGNNV